jgi:hypothetical protein
LQGYARETLLGLDVRTMSDSSRGHFGLVLQPDVLDEGDEESDANAINANGLKKQTFAPTL